VDTADPQPRAPRLVLGDVSDDSLAATLCAVVGHGVQLRPQLAAELRGSVLLRLVDGYSAVRIDFRGDEIEIADDDGDADRAHDLEITGRLGDFSALIGAPLAGGLPKPTTRRGRHALARLADGRVELDGPLRLARRLLTLLAVESAPARAERRTGKRRSGTQA
jgi:hypothetical protein